MKRILKPGFQEVSCSKRCGTKWAQVPWARQESGFTLLFESFLLTLCKKNPVAKVVQLAGEHDIRVWCMLYCYIDKARSKADFSQVARVGTDEKSGKRSRQYITLPGNDAKHTCHEVSEIFTPF